MEIIVKQWEALKSCVENIITGSKQAHLLLLLENFHQVLVKLPEATEVIEAHCASEISELEDVKQENTDEMVSCEASELSDNESGDEDEKEEQISETMACMLCGLEEADSLESHQSQDDDEMSPKELYANWKELSRHVGEKHCTLDISRVKKSSYVIMEGQLMHRTGRLIKTMRIISKYSLLKCPRCVVQLNPGVSFKNGYLKLCCHLHQEHHLPLASHVKLHQCVSCNYNSHSEYLLTRHIEYNHSGVKNKYNQKVCCPICKKFLLQRFLTKHIEAIHSHTTKLKGQMFSCGVCHKEYSSKKNLERHEQRVHHQVKDFLCHMCSCAFYENKDLVNHMYMKHKVNPQKKTVFSCQMEGCDFTALAQDALSRHFTLCHASTKAFTCGHCGKAFNAAHNLKQHEEIMHSAGSKQYRCSQCSFHTHVLQYLKRHMKVHSESKKHRCSFVGCDYKSNFLENLKKHLKIHSPHHQLSAKTKKDHNYIKPKRKSSKNANSSSSTFAGQSAAPLTMTQQPDLSSMSQQYISYGTTHADLPQTSGYQQVLPISVKQENLSMKGAGLINQNLAQESTSNIVAVNEGPSQYYQQYADLSRSSNSYLSL